MNPEVLDRSRPMPREDVSDRLEFTVPDTTVFSVPMAEALTEPPEDLDKYLVVRSNRGGEDRLLWVAKRALLLRRDANHNHDIPDDRNEQPQSWWRKDKERSDRMDILEHKKKKIEYELENTRAECRHLRIQNRNLEHSHRELQDRFRNLVKQFNALDSLAERAAAEAKQARETQVKDKKAWEEDRKMLSDHIASLRGGLDDMKITEEELMREYEQFLRLVEGCVAALPHIMPAEKLHIMEWPRNRLGLDPTQVGVPAEELDSWLLAGMLVHSINEAVQPMIYSTMTEWLQDSNVQGTQDFAHALSIVEADLATRIGTDLYAKRMQQDGLDTKGKRRAAGPMPKQDPATMAKAFYRWRADTTRLFSSANAEYAATKSDSSRADVVELIATKFLQDLTRLPDHSDAKHKQDAEGSSVESVEQDDDKSHSFEVITGTPTSDNAEVQQDDPYEEIHHPQGESTQTQVIEHLSTPVKDDPIIHMAIFNSASEPENVRKMRRTRFLSQLDKCVVQAIRLYTRLRSCRANYCLMWAMSDQPFRSAWMEIVPKLPEKAVGKLPGNIAVQHCRYPALLKYGDDEGKEYEFAKCIKKADIIIPVTYERPRSSSVSMPECIEVDDEENTNGDGRMKEAERSSSQDSQTRKLEALPTLTKSPNELDPSEQDMTALPKSARNGKSSLLKLPWFR